MFKLLPKISPEQLAHFKHIPDYEYVLSYYVQSKLGRKKPILGAMKLTRNCNLECAHCPFCQKDGNALTYAKALDCMKILSKWGVRILILEGGEPFLWRDGGHDVRKLVLEARKLFFSVGIVTNGTFPIDVKTDVVWVSIDGLRDTHNQLRGDSFDAAIANIEASEHPRIFAHITINALNRQEIPELVNFLKDYVAGVTIQFHYPYKEDEHDENLFVSVEARRDVLDSLISLKKQGLPITDSYACLEALKTNRWECHSWMLANVEPDGTKTRRCYAKTGALSPVKTADLPPTPSFRSPITALSKPCLWA